MKAAKVGSDEAARLSYKAKTQQNLLSDKKTFRRLQRVSGDSESFE